jgi:hypothetical protein
MFIACTVNAQKPVKLDSLGNYISLTQKSSNVVMKTTGKYYVDSKGVKYAICESVNGKFYYVKTSKTGNEYKVYLKLQ